MAGESLVLNDVLCFLLNKIGKVAVKQIRSALNDFYIADDIASAKMRLSEDIKSFNEATSRTTTTRRLAREVDDIISLVTFLDEQKLLNSIPRYVASSPDRMPRIRLYEGDLSGIMNVLHDMGNRLTDLSAAVATINRDTRGLQTVLPVQSLGPYATNKTVNPQPNVNKVPTNHGNSGQPARTETESTTERIDLQAGGYIDKRCGDGSVRSDWAAAMSTPVSSANRFAVLAGTTDDEDYPPLQSSFVTVQSRRAKRQRQKTPQHPAATTEPSLPSQPRRISVVGKSAVTVSSKILATKKIRKKAVFCIDNTHVVKWTI